MGPFDYEITTTRNIIAFDKDAGTLTYDDSKVFTCAMDDPEDCNTPITQLNIPFQPQVVGATGLAIENVMDLTKVGFSAGVMAIELESFSAAKKTADDLALSYAGIQAGAMTDGVTLDAATASMMIGGGWYDEFNDYFALVNGSEMNNMTGQGEMINYTTAIQGLQAQEAALGVNTAGVTFAGNASVGDLSTAFDSAVLEQKMLHSQTCKVFFCLLDTVMQCQQRITTMLLYRLTLRTAPLSRLVFFSVQAFGDS